MVERARVRDSLPHNIITREMAKEMFEETTKLYRRKTPAKAIRMDGRFSIETRDGIVTGRPGDYIVDATDDGTPIVIPGEKFSTIFYELSSVEIKEEQQSQMQQDVAAATGRKKQVPAETVLM